MLLPNRSSSGAALSPWTSSIPLTGLTTTSTPPRNRATSSRRGSCSRAGGRLRLLAGAPRPPVDAAELARARELRDALYRALATIACDAAPRPDDLRVIASTHAEAMAAAELAPSGAAWGWEWGARDPRRVRFAVAVDAVRLLEDGDRLARVTRCPGRHCGWLFINASGRRRWCSMTTCGSREKMRRMYRRRRPSSKS
jgi:predicted RNA-binding Zn ribbon-like protein